MVHLHLTLATSVVLIGHRDAVNHQKNCKCVLRTVCNLEGVWVYGLFVEGSQKNPLIELMMELIIVLSSAVSKYVF